MPSPMNKIGVLRTILRMAANLKWLVLLIRDYITGRYRRISRKSLAAILITAAYLLLPTDVIYDLLPGLGQIDDALILGGCLYLLENDLLEYKNWKQGRSQEDMKESEPQ